MDGSVGQQHDTAAEHQQGARARSGCQLSSAEAKLDESGGLRCIERSLLERACSASTAADRSAGMPRPAAFRLTRPAETARSEGTRAATRAGSGRARAVAAAASGIDGSRACWRAYASTISTSRRRSSWRRSPLGGVLNTRHKATGEIFDNAVATMTTLNQ
jgi:hypothetical protein